MNTMIANNNKWFTGATDVDFIRENEILRPHGTRHNPISSAEILTKFREKANSLGMELVNEQGALLRQKVNKKTGETVGGDRYMYVAEVKSETNPDFGLAVGFRNFSDESLAFSGMCESHIFVCENGVCHGIVKPSKMRHTIGNIGKNLIDEKIDLIFSRFNNEKDAIKTQIGSMISTPLTDEIVGRFVKGMVGNPYVGSANVMRIIEDLENPERNDKNDNSVMRLMNSCSHITSHTFSNPNQAMLGSNFCNNLIMKIIKGNTFTPLGDVVDETLEGEVID